MFCKALNSEFTAIQRTDCPADGWEAVQVWRCGNSATLGHFDTEDAAEACAFAAAIFQYETMLRAILDPENQPSQFGTTLVSLANSENEGLRAALKPLAELAAAELRTTPEISNFDSVFVAFGLLDKARRTLNGATQ
jgi:hypothetical protein